MMSCSVLHYFLLFFCITTYIKADSARYYYDYECNEPLVEAAKLSATSSLRERGPENAKLYGLNAWTASENDFDQRLVIDLGSVKNITRVATQGRAHSREFVQEYHISYGSNGLDYVRYKAPGGEVKMFEGNHDGNTVVKNEFEVPIIAQYIRINPMRWRDKISMRVEVYGCDYVADTLYFNGSSLVKVDLLRDPISASREAIRFRFKTTVASGALMYSRGTQGDYIALQLRDNRLVLNIDLGSGTLTSLSVGSLLDDNIWHDVVISRKRRDIVFSVDRVVVQGQIKGEFSRLNLNRALYIGGVPNFQEGMVVTQNFTGCVENMYLNNTNVIQDLKQGYETGEAFKFQKVNTLYSCPEPPVVPITFLKEGSYAKLRGYSGGNTLNVSLEFRTYEHHGLLIYHKFKTDGYVKVFLEEGKVKVELFTKGSTKVKLDNYAEEFNDGRWHSLMLTMAPDSLVLAVDFRPLKTTKLLKFITGSTYYIAGGKAPTRGFVGCMRKIAMDGNYRLPTDWKKEEYCCPNELVFDACHMIDRCNPNPCEHGGVCTQSADEFTCDCADTGYAGAVCHSPVHPVSCGAYGRAGAGGRAVLLDVDGSGPLPPFPATCHFYSDRIVTAVHHSSTQSTQIDGYQEAGSFRQDIVYDASRAQLEALLNRSLSCSQRLEYFCKHSRLLNSPSTEADFHPFAWWVSRSGQRMDYWAGAQAGSRMCQCGVLGTCVDPTKWCNCDAEHGPLARDGVYGVSVGCVGKCESSPCLNNGTCLERYDSYSCDCRWTAFKGPICADEIGVNLRPNSMVKYDFLGSWRSTINEKIRVGFTTTNPKGFLLGFYSNISGEYLTLMVSNSGHLRVVFDFGFERQEIIFQGKHFGLGQYHDVRLSRKDSGATMVLQVDNYETQEYHFNIRESADAQFNNIQYMYMGRNETMSEGFVGCVSRVEFDDIYPLKLLFQQDPPPNVRTIGGVLHEDFCGVEPVTHPPERAETRPPPPADLASDLDYHRTDEAILGTVLAFIFLLLIVVAIVLVRALSRHKGEYLTQEERGADGAADPDAAALAAATGPRVTKRREFFI
ncbi:neurexin-4 isoform X3 [Vanessa tameamea]|uniref:Neurexin-4 isoform X3 n=1 Tax=Vanessa tameamea TaxID=334116 RepID=A0ABM4AJP3_VANTA